MSTAPGASSCQGARTWQNFSWGFRKGPSTLAHRTSGHRVFVTSAHRYCDNWSLPSGHLVIEIFGHLLIKIRALAHRILKILNPIIKIECVSPGHVKDDIYGTNVTMHPLRQAI